MPTESQLSKLGFPHSDVPSGFRFTKLGYPPPTVLQRNTATRSDAFPLSNLQLQEEVKVLRGHVERLRARSLGAVSGAVQEGSPNGTPAARDSAASASCKPAQVGQNFMRATTVP